MVLVFLFYPTTLGLLIGSFSPFIFKEIIDSYVLIAILYIAFWLFSYFSFLSSFALFSYDLMPVFTVMGLPWWLRW